MSAEPPPLYPPPIPIRRQLTILKLFGIGLLILALHVPLILTHGVLKERQGYQAQATQDIASLWGKEQTLIGPVLEVPYTYGKGTVTKSRFTNGQWTEVEEPAVQSAYAYFLPDDLHVEGGMEPEVRHRGIYDAVVYTTRLKVAGRWLADFAAAGIEAERIDWDKARVLLGVSDLHGLRSITPVRLAGGRETPFEPVESAEGFLPVAARLGAGAAAAKAEFAFDLVVQGSEALRLAPVGRTTAATLRANWRDPSFTGAWLPVRREVNPDGFTAEWTVANFSRGFPQSWTTRAVSTGDVLRKIGAGAFGVRLSPGVNGYSMVERAQKYGVLFFTLIFAVFFLFEITSALRIHPLQYAMVGAALCLFFLGFLALSEFLGVAAAYVAAAAACTAMVSLYAWSFLHTGLRTGIVAAELAATYGCLYFVLQSQDYALIAGTAALFAALALVMFFTRRVNWYAVDR